MLAIETGSQPIVVLVNISILKRYENIRSKLNKLFAECIIPEKPNNVDETTEINSVPVATNGDPFPWDDVR